MGKNASRKARRYSTELPGPLKGGSGERAILEQSKLFPISIGNLNRYVSKEIQEVRQMAR